MKFSKSRSAYGGMGGGKRGRVMMSIYLIRLHWYGFLTAFFSLNFSFVQKYVIEKMLDFLKVIT